MTVHNCSRGIESVQAYFDNALDKARADNARKVPVRIIDNKTDDCIVWMLPEEYENYMRLHRRVGQQSKLRNVLDNGGKAQ